MLVLDTNIYLNERPQIHGLVGQWLRLLQAFLPRLAILLIPRVHRSFLPHHLRSLCHRRAGHASASPHPQASAKSLSATPTTLYMSSVSDVLQDMMIDQVLI